jgi:pyridoxamine 5'-phosphate oxidase
VEDTLQHDTRFPIRFALRVLRCRRRSPRNAPRFPLPDLQSVVRSGLERAKNPKHQRHHPLYPIVFYTNYNGAKGHQIESAPFASAVFHWDHDERQVRIRGPIVKATEEESDAYFASRALESRLGAWISDQSQPIESREALLSKVALAMEKLGISATDLLEGNEIDIPRPPHWGGFRIIAQSMELWSGGVGRIHDRARWTRELTKTDSGYTASTWSSTRLEP